jgi:hypothetical protein
MRIPSKDFISVCDTNAGDNTTWHINHDACTVGADTRSRLYVTKKDAYTFLAYCHNCSGWGVVKVKQKRGEWVKYVPRNTAGREVNTDSVEVEPLPTGLSHNVSMWPLEVREWLAKYHILTGMNGPFAGGGYINFFSYSPSMNRLIIRLVEATNADGKNPITFWQGRDCTGNSPLKYYTGVGSTTQPIVIRQDAKKPTEKLFITEDITSAVRIANCGYDALPLRGTSCHDYDALAAIVCMYDKTIIWLDDDKAGRIGQTKLAERLRLLRPGKIQTTYYVGEAKTFSPEKLKEYVDGR